MLFSPGLGKIQQNGQNLEIQLGHKAKELYQSKVERILMYGAETWTKNACMHKKLDGCYKNHRRRAQKLSWEDYRMLQEIYTLFYTNAGFFSSQPQYSNLFL